MPPQPFFTFIVNPVAGRGKAKHFAVRLRKFCDHASVPHSIVMTEYRGHGTLLAQEASTKSDYVVAVGGDGTVNEIASGLVGTNATLAVLSEGSGNDFARLVNAPSKIDHFFEKVFSGKRMRFDVGKSAITHADGRRNDRYFFNSLGLGFDAAVAKHVEQITWLRGIPLYATALVQTLAGYRPHRFMVSANGHSQSDNYFLVCVGNGMWEGGGFKLTPHAVPDDGKFQVCCVRGNSVFDVLPILPFTLSGKHIAHKTVDVFDTDSIVVDCQDPFTVHGDGEIFGETILKMDISLLPKALNVVVTHS